MLILISIILLSGCQPEADQSSINSFDECAAAGYPIMESYPQQCRTADGRLFVQDIGDELEKMDLIRVDEPRPNTEVGDVITVSGEARGTWFFEGDFPIRVTDLDGNVIGESYATAKSNWMTEDFVQFEGTIEAETDGIDQGTLILEKANPSGLPEYEDELRIPVRFSIN